MRRLLAGLAAAALLVSQPSASQPLPPPVPPAPRLVIVISVDQLSADLFDDYRTRFTGGLARLATGGVVFRNGYQAQGSTETCPGHSTILTGALPARSGIVANAWRDQAAPRNDKGIYCAEDESVAGSSSGNYTVSPAHLKSPTFGDVLKRQSPASRNVAIAGKDRSAVMMSGKSADQRWYWSGNRFVTDLAAMPVPRSVGAVNAFIQSRIAAAQPPLISPPLCQSRAQQYRAGENVVGAGRFERAAGDSRGFRNSPELDGAVLAMAAGLVRELGLGRDNAPDVLSIGLSASDFVGHAFGSGGQEMCLQLLALDRSLGDFFSQLDRWGISYNVILTADHGGLDMPERLRAKGVTDAQRVDPALTVKAIGAQVARQTGLAGPILTSDGPAGDNYLDPALRGRDRDRALAAAIAAYRAYPQVHSVFSKDEIARSVLPTGDPSRWTLLERVRASFDAKRSGDLYVVFKPNIAGAAGSGYVAGHGSPWDYDRRVPIIFWRPGVPPMERQDAIATTDIMPTLAALMRVPIDQAAIDGRCVTRLAGIACP